MDSQQREAAMSLSTEDKWAKILHHNRKAENKKTESPLFFCSHLQSMMISFWNYSIAVSNWSDAFLIVVEPSLKLLQSLLTIMQAKPISWLNQFVDAEGASALSSLMSNLLNTPRYGKHVTHVMYIHITVLFLLLFFFHSKSKNDIEMLSCIVLVLKQMINHKVWCGTCACRVRHLHPHTNGRSFAHT